MQTLGYHGKKCLKYEINVVIHPVVSHSGMYHNTFWSVHVF